MMEFVDDDGRTRWKLDVNFLQSGWSCIWGDGCQGIHDEARPELHDGCCSLGVELIDEEEAMTIDALGASLPPELFQHAAERPLVTHTGTMWHTTVVDGACVFFNKPGFAGGVGCALHLAALADGDDPVDAKPQTCTRMPIRVDEETADDGMVELTVRPWTRTDWGPGGATMAWWCTEDPQAYRATSPLVQRHASELRVLFGDATYERVLRLFAE